MFKYEQQTKNEQMIVYSNLVILSINKIKRLNFEHLKANANVINYESC